MRWLTNALAHAWNTRNRLHWEQVMRILIVDDHPLYRDALARLLMQMFPQAIVAQAADCVVALDLLTQTDTYDLVLLDLNIPGMNGYEALTRIRATQPQTKVIMISATERREDVLRCLQAGASGFIPKSARTEVLAAALKLVNDGGLYLPPQVLEAGSVMAPNEPTVSQQWQPIDGAQEKLTHRETEVLVLLCAGQSNRAIANRLNISEATVRTHLSAVFRTLGVANLTQAARAARKLGMVRDD